MFRKTFSFAFFSNPLDLLDYVSKIYDLSKKIGLHFFKNVFLPENPRWPPQCKIHQKSE